MTNHGSQFGSIGRAAETARTINRLHGPEGAGGVWGGPGSIPYFLFLTSV